MPEGVIWFLVIAVSLVVGFLIGWLLEYYLDLKYWEMRARRRGLFSKEEQDKDVSSLLTTGPAPVINRTNEQLADTLREQLKKHEREISTLRAEQDKQDQLYKNLERQYQQYMATHPDDMTSIRGIGRIYQWKLRDAGIASFEQLAAVTPERLREILQVPDWRKFEPESWIEQAKVMAQRDE